MTYKYMEKHCILPIKINDQESEGVDFTGEIQRAIQLENETEITQTESYTPEVYNRLLQAEALIGNLVSEEYIVTDEGYRDVYQDLDGKFYLNYDNNISAVVKVYCKE